MLGPIYPEHAVERYPWDWVYQSHLAELRLMLGRWLETRGSSIQLAVTLDIDRNVPQITIKRWELGARQSLYQQYSREREPCISCLYC